MMKAGFQDEADVRVRKISGGKLPKGNPTNDGVWVARAGERQAA
jgi:hypothetical protein